MKFFLKVLNIFISAQIIVACATQDAKREPISIFEIFDSNHKAAILYDQEGDALDSIAAHLLAEDIFKVTQHKPQVVTSAKNAQGHVIVLGDVKSELIASFIDLKTLRPNFINQPESYFYQTVATPNDSIQKAFIIAGTDARGTAFGVFDLSKRIGVSPWNWWADVPVRQNKSLVIRQSEFYSKAPSVAYRGIFLNDEDWGLQPWAEHNFEPESGDIGPKTYAKIFELLLRLKANTIWPAMHPSTKAFFHYHGNLKMAELYHIALGSSHAEPMLRNNVDEWDKKKNGSFNYKTNKENVFKYWEDRVKEAKNVAGVYTIGMRGVHDSGMEGVKSKAEAVELLKEIIADQRGLIKNHINPDVKKVPQAFTVYKEVLDLYKNGLEVPDDVTLVWTDDNYGYIRALSDEEEQKRPGGGGIYYHASYWGRPHDYLWLSSTNPYLIQEEMTKAYRLNNKKIWILNVGDIKPAEYNIQLFMDMAFDTEKFQDPTYVKLHQQEFFKTIFGDEIGSKIADIKEQYYQLAFERKPEFMGWSQTEKTTPIYKSDYNALSFGDEIKKRIDAYADLEQQVENIENTLGDKYKSAFTQLVAYPVKAASNMNKKFMYRDKALTYAALSRKSAKKYKHLVNQAYQNIVTLTKQYNHVSNGKWKGIMDMAPRRLPVFENPTVELPEIESKDLVGISVEDTTFVKGVAQLPKFYVNDTASHFADVYLKSANNATWRLDSLPNWLRANPQQGVLNEVNSEQRIHFSVNWKVWKNSGSPATSLLNFELGDEIKTVQVNISESYLRVPDNRVVEKNGLAVVYAENFLENKIAEKQQWKTIDGLGHSKAAVQVLPLNRASVLRHSEAAVLTYEIFTETITNQANLQLVAIPTHPLTTDGEVRIAVQWNDGPVQMVNFKTHGRSPEWKQNVLTNKAIKDIEVSIKNKGKQTLKVYAVDAGVLLDYILLNTVGGTPYSLMSETRINDNKSIN